MSRAVEIIQSSIGIYLAILESDKSFVDTESIRFQEFLIKASVNKVLQPVHGSDPEWFSLQCKDLLFIHAIEMVEKLRLLVEAHPAKSTAAIVVRMCFIAEILVQESWQ